MFESEPHKTNVLPKEFEREYKMAVAKWSQLEEVEDTQLVYLIETGRWDLTYQGDLGEAKFADDWDDGIYLGEMNEDDEPITRDRTYFGQTYEFEGKQIPQGYGRFISYTGDIIEGQITKGKFNGFIRLITGQGYYHYFKYNMGTPVKSINFNPWDKKLPTTDFGLDENAS